MLLDICSPEEEMRFYERAVELRLLASLVSQGKLTVLEAAEEAGLDPDDFWEEARGAEDWLAEGEL